MGVGTADPLLAIIGDVETTAYTGEPGIADFFILGEEAYGSHHRQGDCQNSLEFHNDIVFFRFLEMINNTEGCIGAEVQRETGITLAAAVVILARTDAVEVIDIGFCVHVDEEAEVRADVILEHGAETEAESQVLLFRGVHRVDALSVKGVPFATGHVPGVTQTQSGVEFGRERTVFFREAHDIQDGILDYDDEDWREEAKKLGYHA